MRRSVIIVALALAACEAPTREDVGYPSEHTRDELTSERQEQRMEAIEETRDEQQEEREEAREQSGASSDLWEGPEEALEADEPRHPEVHRR